MHRAATVEDAARDQVGLHATDPTTECAACGSTAVYLTVDGAVVCGKCGAALELEITSVSPA